MKLRELVVIMNINDVGVTSHTIRELFCEVKLNMLHLESDPILMKYGDYEVESLTNICKTGDLITIK